MRWLLDKLKSIFCKPTEIPTVPKTRTELQSMDKKELEVYARSLGVELDRRRSHRTLVAQVLEAQTKQNVRK